MIIDVYFQEEDTSFKYEIIIVDDGSGDKTSEVLLTVILHPGGILKAGKFLFSVLRYLMFQMLLDLHYAILKPSISFGYEFREGKRSQSFSRRSVLPGLPRPDDRSLPLHHQPST